MIKKISTRHDSVFKRARRWLAGLSRKKRAAIVLALCLTLGIVGTLTVFGHRAEPARDPAPVAAAAPQKGTPTYPTVLPKGKTAASLGGWTRVSPPDRNPVYAYVDVIGTTRAIISEQELPQSFLSDPDAKTKELATAYNATTQLTVGSTIVYTGITTHGVESVILHTKSLLVLIKADASIDDTALKDYVSSLE